MKILGISGSPRKSGNTDILLDRALAGASRAGAEAEKVILNELKFAPCQECDNIRNDGACVVNDDMQRVYEKIGGADAVILASPVFFGSISAQTKMMIDRFQCFWLAKYKFHTVKTAPGKNGAFLCVSAGGRADFFENAKSIARNFFATLGIDYRHELFCPGVEEKGDMLKHADYLRKAEEMGMKLAT